MSYEISELFEKVLFNGVLGQLNIELYEVDEFLNALV